MLSACCAPASVWSNCSRVFSELFTTYLSAGELVICLLTQHPGHLRDYGVEVDLVEPLENPNRHRLRLLERVRHRRNLLQRCAGRRDHLDRRVRLDVERNVQQAGDKAVRPEVSAQTLANQMGIVCGSLKSMVLP